MKHFIFSAALSVTALTPALLAPSALAHDGDKPRIDDHAPIGVMADHFHRKGEWMASARFMAMGMDDPTGPMMGPQDMDMSMTMVGVMYAPSDKLTLAGMIGYSHREMDMTMMGTSMERTAGGVTDLKLNAIVPVATTANSRFLVKLGMSAPIGDTSETDAMNMLLPLPMQPGKDAWALTPTATYSFFGDGWSAGAQLGATLWLDHATTGEKPGDQWQATAWASKTLTDRWSLSARLAYEDQSAWTGVNPMSGGARNRLRGFIGTNLYATGTHRIGVELGIPLSEDRGTNNLGTGTSLIVGWQKAF